MEYVQFYVVVKLGIWWKSYYYHREANAFNNGKEIRGGVGVGGDVSTSKLL